MTKPERAQFIHAKIRSALGAIQNDPRYDWRPAEIYFAPGEKVPESPKGAAATKLSEVMQKFVDGKADETAVKETYKSYVSTYAR